jgi:Mg/Co/Ni transporter MgtE
MIATTPALNMLQAKSATVLSLVLGALTLDVLLKVLHSLPDDESHVLAISLIKTAIRADILKAFSHPDCIKMINKMVRPKQASMLRMVGEQMRIGILSLMDGPSYQATIENLKEREKKMIANRDDKIPDNIIMTYEFPQSWPESARHCIVCGDPYSVGQTIVRANCCKHSFHKGGCKRPNSVCPEYH